MSAPVNMNDSISGRVIAATVIGMVLPTISVLMRIVARKLKAAKLYGDDYLIVLALVCAIIYHCN